MTSSCEKDDFLDVKESNISTFKMSGSTSSLSKIKGEDEKLFNFMSDRALNIAKSSNSTTGTILDTANIQVLEGVDFKNYIFKVLPDSTTTTTDVLKNYMLVVLKDSIRQQFMVTYPYVNQVVDTTNVLIEPIYGTDILNQVTLKCGGGSYQSVWIPGGSVDIRCRSRQHTVDDGPGSGGTDGCKFYGGSGSASRIYYDGYFTTQYVDAIPCATLLDPGDPRSGGGGGSSGNSPPPDDIDNDDDVDTITIGITPNEGLDPITTDSECDYLNDLLDSSIFKSRLNQLIFDARDKNYEIIHEYTKGILDADDLPVDSLAFHADQGTNNKPEAPIRKLPNNIIRTMVVHTHYEGDASNDGTISMFSYPDLQVFLVDVLKANITGKDTSQMTSILVAANSQSINVYAIKKDPNSTLASNYDFHQNVVLQMTEPEKKAERYKYQEAIEKSEDQDGLEITALQQLEKMGLQLYRSKDAHNSWEQLTLNPTPSDPDEPELGASIPCN